VIFLKHSAGTQSVELDRIFIYFKSIVACTSVTMQRPRAISRQQLDIHVSAATDTHATTVVLLETVFSTRSVQRGYKEDNWGNLVISVWETVKRALERGS
jgi:hypothetical protein